MLISPVENHRNREDGFLVYPVYSRRSGGLSIGINFFPNKKVCSFDCPYCEVFPFANDIHFTVEAMRKELIHAIHSAEYHSITVQDICLSGNGEPTMSPHFIKALAAVRKTRDKTVPEANVVVITNGTGLLNDDMFAALRTEARERGVKVWMKLDAGTESWFRLINRTDISFAALMAKIQDFAVDAPLILQTMLCSVDGSLPPGDEEEAWNALVLDLAKTGNVREVQLYSKARPAPSDPDAAAVSESYLEKRAAALRELFLKSGVGAPVSVYL